MHQHTFALLRLPRQRELLQKFTQRLIKRFLFEIKIL